MFTVSNIYKQKAREAMHLALPIIAGQLGQILMGFFDTIQIGGLGEDYIAASGFANGLYWMTNLLGMGVLFAVSTLVSEVFGEKQEWKAISIYRSGIKVALLLSVIFTAVMFFLIYHIQWFGQEVRVNELAVRFLRIITVSTIFVFVYTACKQFMDGMGRTKIGMVVTLSGLVLNIFLNWALIYGHAGFPKLEIEGAALATSISRMLMTVAILIIIWRDKQVIELRKQFLASIHRSGNYIKQIFAIGVPTGLQFFWEVAAFNAAMIMSGWLGIKYEAAHQIAITYASITFMVLTGIALAGNIMTGYSYGARDKEGIRIAGNTVFVLTLGIELLFVVFFLVGNTFLPTLFTSQPEVIAIASSMLIFAAIFQVSDGLQAVASGALRGIQDVRIPSIIAFVSYWLIMIPAGYLLAFKLGWGLKGLWVGFIIGLSVAAIALLLRFKWISKRVEFKEV